jgi:hypothetical protein
VSYSGTSAIISFTPGLSRGGVIINYQYSTDGGATYTVFSPSVTSSPVTITGLTSGTTYPVKLKAINALGLGAESTALSVTIPTAPSAPTSLSYSASGTSAFISFSAGSDGGSTITNYQYSTDGGTSFSAFSPADTSSPVTITGLNGGYTYSVLLKAVNIIGASPGSSALSVTMPATSPSAPGALSSSEIGASSVKISFSAGLDGGSAITNYKYSINGGTSFTAFSPAITASPVTITGLTGDSGYSIVIKAVNAEGDGVASPTLSVTTSTILGSLLFNGTSSELKLNPGASVGSGAFTVECWFYNNSGWNTQSTNPINYASLLGHSASTETGQNVAGALAIAFIDDKTVRTDWNGGGWQLSYVFANSITINAWHHFVLVRNSSQVETVFIDGIKATSCSGGTIIRGGQQTNNKDYSGDSVEIGHFYQGYWPGYLANFRIVVGSDVYTPLASFATVPTGALTNITGTKYLMVGDSATNDGSNTQTVTNVDVTVSTSLVPL